MLGRLIFTILIVFMFVNTDQSIAGSYITKKSDATKEEKKLKKEYIKKKKKVDKENKKEFIKKKEKLSDKAKTYITKKSLTSLSKYYTNINELPQANFYFFAKNEDGVTYIGYIKDDKASKILTKKGINVKKELKGKAYLVEGKVICNVHSEIKDFQVIDSVVLATRTFSLGCTKGNKNEKILGYWTQMDKSGTGRVRNEIKQIFEVQIFKGKKNTLLALAKIESKAEGLALGPASPTHRTEEKYYALIIGNSEYDNVTDLDAPVNDARAINNVLVNKYNFITYLLEDATRGEILDKLQEITSKLNREDNLLVYYAGHGEYIIEQKRGYWLPRDAHSTRRSTWINTQTIVDEIKLTRAKHVLLLIDSCFSASLTRSNKSKTLSIKKDSKNYEIVNRKYARIVITSGGNERVEDSDGKGRSYFSKKLEQILKENEPGQILSSYEIFLPIHTYVVDNAKQNPERDTIKETGHDGGDFLFFAKIE